MSEYLTIQTDRVVTPCSDTVR